MRKMGLTLIFGALVLLCSSSAHGQPNKSPPAPPRTTMTPAPAPAPAHVNLTKLLSVAGPFSTFLEALQSTKVIDTFQSQANNTKDGVTIFVPSNKAFSSIKQGVVSNLTQDQLKQLLLLHALPHYYSLAEFKKLSQAGSTSTFAGGNGNALNITDDAGTVKISTGLVSTKVISSVYSTPLVGVYEVPKVLVPKGLFANDTIPVAPVAAPAPSPGKSPAADADSPSAPTADAHSPKSSRSVPSSSHRCISWVFASYLALPISGLLVFFL